MEQFAKIGVLVTLPIMTINDRPVYHVGEEVDDRQRAIDREYAESMRKLKKKEIVPLLTSYFLREEYTEKHREELFSGHASQYWWQIMEEIEKFVFSTKKGRKARAELKDYGRIAQRAEELVPVCEELLGKVDGKTKNTAKEILEFLKKDHPEPCEFLLTHLSHLESALSNENFLGRRRTLSGRARLLAYGMAGADFGYELSTSAAIAAQGKRRPS
jgi:hypothetical protein